MEKNDCDKCLWATRSGDCVRWRCEFVDKQEAYDAWRRLQDIEPDTEERE